MTKLNTHLSKGPGQLIDLFGADFKTRYFDLVKKISSLEREKIRLQLAASESEDIYNNSPCGYHSLNANGVFVRINNTELKWLGYSREELLCKMKFSDILAKSDVVNYKKNLIELKKTGYVKEEYSLKRKDNSLLPMLLNSIAIFDKKGKFKTSRSVLVNMPGKRLNDQILETQKILKNENIELQQANEEMSLLNEAKDRFIGIAYHDLQNPLAVIMLMSKILLGEEVTTPNETNRGKYQTIYEASLQMNELIKNYLNVNRMETGSIILNLAKVDIIKITEGIISRYQEIAERKNIPIFFTSGRRNIILTDAECYSQIIENLLSNAIKYTPHGKSIFVKIQSKGVDVFVTIEDEGVGIKEEEIPLLYGKFQQLSSRPTGGELSTGLGLSIVKYLIDQLKGTIAVKSKPGKGTRFVVHFTKET